MLGRTLLSLLLSLPLFCADKTAILRSLDARAEHYGQLAQRIWEFAELGYHETRSAALQQEELRKSGFRIETNIAGAPTAFTATWGSGKPVIGIMGEFDALPELSQAVSAEKKPLQAGAPGHGCGHNLLGIASLAAAIQVKEAMERAKLPGTIRYYGTPAEEGGAGKVYMAQAGAFRDVDAVLAWHPSSMNDATPVTSTAIVSGRFQFHGVAAHAAGAPERGRSALDAVMLMNMAVEMLREHVPNGTRMHYTITKGGAAPNIVPELAEVYLYARHPQMPELLKVWERIRKCAEGAALATETRLEAKLSSSSWNLLPSLSLNRIMDRNMRLAGGVSSIPPKRGTSPGNCRPHWA